MLLARCTTQARKRVKKKKKKNILGHEKFAARGFEPGPFQFIRSEMNTSICWTTSVSAEITCLKEVSIPSPW